MDRFSGGKEITLPLPHFTWLNHLVPSYLLFYARQVSIAQGWQIT